MYGSLVKGSKFCGEFGIVRQPRLLMALNIIQAIRKSHITVFVMMTVRFPISGNMNKLRLIRFLGKTLEQAVSELLSIIKKTIEGNSLRDIAIVKVKDNAFSRRKLAQIGPARINGMRVHQ